MSQMSISGKQRFAYNLDRQNLTDNRNICILPTRYSKSSLSPIIIIIIIIHARIKVTLSQKCYRVTYISFHRKKMTAMAEAFQVGHLTRRALASSRHCYRLNNVNVLCLPWTASYALINIAINIYKQTAIQRTALWSVSDWQRNTSDRPNFQSN